MNDNLISLVGELFRKKSVRIVILLVMALLIIWVIIAKINQPSPLSAHATGLTFGDTIQAHGNTIDVYNGTSFYRINTTKDNSMQMIYTPTYRLPSVSTAVWAGSKGVLLNFKSGVMNTPVYDYFTAHGIDVTSDNYFTWYLDFSTGELKLVGEYNLQSTVAYYSEKDNGFYYVPDIYSGETTAGTNTLMFYSLDTNSTTTVIDDFNVTPQSITSCAINGGTICIVGTKNSEVYGKYYLFATSKDTKKLSTVYAYDGPIYQTPIDNTYILLADKEEYQGTTSLYKKITTLNIATNEKHDYPGTVFDTAISVGASNDKLYIIDGQNNEVLWLKNSLPNSTQTDSITAENEDVLSEGVSVLTSQYANDVFIASTSGDIYILSTEKLALPKKMSSTESESATKKCVSQYSGTVKLSGNNYTILLPDDENFVDYIKNVKQCLVKQPASMLGYTYNYKGFSSVNGRISTD